MLWSNHHFTGLSMTPKTSTKTASIVIIGNEILAGHTVDANIPYLAAQLNGLGIRLAEVRIVADVQSAIVGAVNECRARYDYVFTTGGIGPTHDDITAESVADAFGLECIEHPAALARLQSYYAAQNVEFNAARRRMARMPKGAEIIENPVSSAPGFKIENVFVMAGVPNIMQAMFKGIEHLLIGGDPILTRAVMCKLPEGTIADELAAIQNKYADIDIGSYPSFRSGAFVLKLVLRGSNGAVLDAAACDIAEMAQKHGDNSAQIEQW